MAQSRLGLFSNLKRHHYLGRNFKNSFPGSKNFQKIAGAILVHGSSSRARPRHHAGFYQRGAPPKGPQTALLFDLTTKQTSAADQGAEAIDCFWIRDKLQLGACVAARANGDPFPIVPAAPDEPSAVRPTAGICRSKDRTDREPLEVTAFNQSNRARHAWDSI